MSTTAEQAAKRADTLNRIRLERQQGKLPGPSIPSSSSSSSSPYPAPPAQSRDGTISSRYFVQPPASPNDTILVPSSSPLRSPANNNTFQSQPRPRWPDVAFRNGGAHTGPWTIPQLAPAYDPLTASSGFASQNNAHKASDTRQFSRADNDDIRPRKRPFLHDLPPKSTLAQSPESPGIQRPGQRRRMLADAGSTSSDESTPESSSRPRLVRGRPADSAEAPPPSTPADPFADSQFIRFNMTMPGYSSNRVKAAWLQAKQDVRLATKLVTDESWVPNPPPHSSPPVASRSSTESHGKVEGVEEAHRARLAALKEKSKKSSIYANRPNAAKPASAATPVVKHPPIDLTVESPTIAQPLRRKRNKNMIVDSDSDEELNESEDDRSHKRSRQESNHELRVLQFFNTQSAEALQELTGCTDVQIKAIVDLRKFTSVDDLNAKLGQGKKKAGPAGLSPRLVDDAVEIFRGYTAVDEILEECEEIGAKLRTSIASWTSVSSNGKGKQTDSLPESVEDGALNLHAMSSLTQHKPEGYVDKQPSLLSDSVKLKDYQLLGLNWLHLLYRSNLSCILADEMGLGKTVQVISFLALLRERGNKGPHLIVVPSSTLENWCREFARFADSISVQVYYGGKNERIELRQTLLDTKRCDKGNEDDADGWEVLITTYNLAQGDSDRKFFRRIEWDCCVFDEGHVLKNFQSQRYTSLLRIKSRWRLLLTGTPLQNNLQELVSLMNFILPEQFGDSLEDLRQIFKVKGDSKASLLAQERVSRAKKMMTPFVLRRRKDQVLQDLPKKTERIEWCETTPLQKSIYRDTLQRSRKTVLESETPVDSAGTSDTNGRSKGPKKTRPPAKAKEKQYLENSANVLMDLRKAALHPMLFRSRFTDDMLSAIAKQLLREPDFKKRGAIFDIVKEDMSVMTDAELQHFCGTYKCIRRYEQPADCFLDSGKIQTLLSLLMDYQKQDRKILIFSQFTQILDILEVILKQKNIQYLVLTGSTPVDVRQSLVDEFTEDASIPVFLLSTKAGGMGINLTAASVVIMFDQDFNPHNDRQAQDRAYRIGQKRDVEVVKLITRGTIEEDMLRLSEMKLALDEAVAGDDDKGESAPEREMKASLMSTLRRQFERQEESDDDIITIS
ncbi:SNF2 family N-terminal domain-containing protein [Lentinula raphanica]|uniref:DNA helicase n=1 Tax=Lentinula raphanica TaxID=153919 RepID=A0AA38PBY5_9AGAR|nr:SNF2 family N-terminal domain-containing protein [Lentinula raphanica]